MINKDLVVVIEGMTLRI